MKQESAVKGNASPKEGNKRREYRAPELHQWGGVAEITEKRNDLGPCNNPGNGQPPFCSPSS